MQAGGLPHERGQCDTGFSQTLTGCWQMLANVRKFTVFFFCYIMLHTQKTARNTDTAALLLNMIDSLLIIDCCIVQKQSPLQVSSLQARYDRQVCDLQRRSLGLIVLVQRVIYRDFMASGIEELETSKVRSHRS